MGKTTLAIQLLLELLATRKAEMAAATGNEIVPVPVLLPISGWDIDKYPLLQDWLGVQLARNYPALAATKHGTDAAARLAKGGYVLPILDGLDEVSEAGRSRVIDALNISLSAHDQLIITSLKREFSKAVKKAVQPLNAAAHIVPKRLTLQASVDYLSACLPASPPDAWRKVLAALENGTAPGLTELAATPLGLWLIRSVYLAPNADPSPLIEHLGSDATALRVHLLDRIIPALIASRPPSGDPADHFRPRRELDPTATRRQLAYLARQFSTTRDIAWWRIAKTGSRGLRLFIQFTDGLVWMLASGGVFIYIFAGADVEIPRGFGFALGLLFGAVGVLGAITWFDDSPGQASLRMRGRTLKLVRSIFSWRHEFMAPVAMGAAGGMAAHSLKVGLLAGISGWLMGVVPHALVEWAEQPILTSISTPRSTWRSDRTLTLLRSLATGLLCGPALGMLGILEILGNSTVSDGGPMATFTVGVGFGFAFGFMGGTALGRHHAWLACAAAILPLAIAKQLPARIMDFLEDAHRLGLLRTVGPIYQFRHAFLHDHFAAHPTDIGSTRRN